MRREPTPAEHAEMLELRTKAQAWIDDLTISGVAEEVAINAILLALVERRLTSGGVTKAVAWLYNMTHMMQHLGPEMLRELRQQGR